MNHVAFSVTNVEEAIKWYRNIQEFTLIKQPREFEADESLIEMVVKDFHGLKSKNEDVQG
jgi:catechol 2,3-dioxygenase-like lactoylglutathione lyase family enzyme